MGEPSLEGAAFAERSGENLVRQRRAADLSQDLLADLTSVHRTEIS